MLSHGTRVKFKKVFPRLSMPTLTGTIIGMYESTGEFFVELDRPASAEGVPITILTTTEEFFTVEEC